MQKFFLCCVCFASALLSSCEEEQNGPGQVPGHDSPRTEVPAGLANGIWQVGSISFGNFWSDQGQYVGAGHDGAIRYYFKADGSYELYSYLSVRSYSCLTQSYTHVTGTVEVEGEHITLHPVSGKYKGADNCVDSYNFERAVREDEMQQFAKSYRWEIATGDDGEERLYMLEDGLPETADNILIYTNESE